MKVIQEVSELKEIIDTAQSIVFLGGAGVSVESGIPDFRSKNGIYSQEKKQNPEKILSHHFFMNQPKLFYDFYKENIIYVDALPNDGHRYVAKLEQLGKLKACITQNIDGLHQKAGSKKVIELHGNIYRNHCIKCKKEFGIDYIITNDNPIRCDQCHGLVKPDVVLYTEPLKEVNIIEAIEAILESDLLIVAGTSLNVVPAADLIQFSKKTVLINLEKTSRDIFCDYVYYGKFAETAKALEALER